MLCLLSQGFLSYPDHRETRPGQPRPGQRVGGYRHFRRSLVRRLALCLGETDL